MNEKDPRTPQEVIEAHNEGIFDDEEADAALGDISDDEKSRKVVPREEDNPNM